MCAVVSQACFSLVQDIVAGSVQQAALSGPTTRYNSSFPFKSWLKSISSSVKCTFLLYYACDLLIVVPFLYLDPYLHIISVN